MKRKFRLVCLVSCTCLSVYVPTTHKSTANIHQTLHAQLNLFREELIRLSRSYRVRGQGDTARYMEISASTRPCLSVRLLETLRKNY